jgi:ATP-dependent RNA helicase DDX35
MTVAMRVADEVGCEVGKEVGYSVRFEDETSGSTQIKFLTDGMLMRELWTDPLLERYSVVMVDEAHERTVSTDLLLGMLKRIQQRRPELRIVVSSATIQAEEFHEYFNRGSEYIEFRPEKYVIKESKPGDPCILIELEGRTHPVDVFYLDEPTENYIARAVDTVFDIHSRELDGDILVFLSGRDEIEKAMQSVADRHEELECKGRTLMPLPMYAGLTSEQQMFIFDKTPENMRKVVFSTNIAEASVTIDGVIYVVDCGFTKLTDYNPSTGITKLAKVPVSKASAQQRTGRAGRTRPGKCYRLYTETAYEGLAEDTVPEFQRANLTHLLLQLKALGVDNLVRFDYLSPPRPQLMGMALELLNSLGALDDDVKLTRPLGARMAELPLEPMLAKTLLSAQEFGCLDEMLTIAAMTSLGVPVWFYKDGEEKKMKQARLKFAAREGDHLTLYNAYHAFVTMGKQESKFCHDNHLNFKSMQKAVRIRNQLSRMLQHLGISVGEHFPAKLGNSRDAGNKGEKVRRCLTVGFFAQAARMQSNGSFRSINGDATFWPHPSSLMFNLKTDWVIYHEAIETKDKIYVKNISEIDRDWLVEYAPHFYQIYRPALE